MIQADSDTLGLWIGAVAAVLVLLQLLILRRQSRLLEVSVMTEVMQEWRAVRGRWHKALMVLRGGAYGFADVDLNESSEFSMALSRQKAAEEAYKEERSDQALRALHEARQEVETYTREVTESLRSLSTIASLILSGRLPVQVAYQILGTELTRQGRTLREAFSDPIGPAGYFAGYYPGIQRRVMLLVDMMWAEAVRLADLSEFELLTARNAKVQGSAAPRRSLLREEAKLLGGWTVALRLDRHAAWSEVHPDKSGLARRVDRNRRWISGMLAGDRSHPLAPQDHC